MSEELLQRDLLQNPEKIGNWDFYNIGATTIKSLKNNKIILDIDYKEIELKKVDALIVQKKNVIAVVEYKKPSEFNSETKINKAIQQELKVAQALSASILITTDTKKSIWINPLTGNKIKNEDGTELNFNFNPKNDETILLIEKITQSINIHNDTIKPKELVNPTDLAKKIWQDIWSVSGATPENCLYTFVELFIFKYLSDLDVLKGIYNFYNLFDNYDTNTTEEVLESYANVIRPKIKSLFPESLIDKTTIINGTIFVSKDQKAVEGYSSVFKKILEKFLKYGKLEHIDYDFKSQLFESFLKESISKKNWGQFFTPLKVVKAIVNMTTDLITEGKTICDPACGVGKFLLEPIQMKLDSFFNVKNSKVSSKLNIRGFDKGFDKDEQKTIILAKANMLIYFSDIIKKYPNSTKEFAEIFNNSFQLKTNSILGTLSEPVQEEYDLILTNPPYVTSGSSNLKEEIKKSGLEYFYSINAVGVEGLFLEWIVKALKPGGTAFIVIPDGLLSRNGDGKLREYILKNCFIDCVFSLPEKTFFTTLKKTYILGIRKKNNINEIQDTPVFSYLVSNIGETLDVYRIEIPEDDLSEGVILYNQFKGAKNFFKTTDLRCKLVPYSWFFDNYSKSWIIEKLWDDETLISLGLKDEENIIKVDEFSSYLSNLSEIIQEYQTQLDNLTSTDNNFKEIGLTDSNYFEIIPGALGFKKDEYAKIDTKNNKDIPIYTATLKPVAFIDQKTVKRKANEASNENPHISFASDGDGTAGTNIVFHNRPYFINTSRHTFKVLDEKIHPLFVYFALKDIKRKYGFNFKFKATLKNLDVIKIKVPVEKSGEFNLKKQIEIAEKSVLISELKKELKSHFDKIIDSRINLD